MHHFPFSVEANHYSQLLQSRSNRLLDQGRQSSMQDSTARHDLDSQELSNNGPFTSLSFQFTPEMKNSNHPSSSTISISPSSISGGDRNILFCQANNESSTEILCPP